MAAPKGKKQPGRNAVKHPNLHTEMSRHAASIYSGAVGGKGGNHLVGAADDFTVAGGDKG